MGLTEADFRNLNRDPALITPMLKKFTTASHHIKLLNAIDDKASLYLLRKEPLRKKLKKRRETLQKNILEIRRADPNQDKFFPYYHEEKYETHEVTSVEHNKTVLKVQGEKKSRTVQKIVQSGTIHVEYLRPIDMSPREMNDCVAMIGHAFCGSMEHVSHDNARITHYLLQKGDTRVVLIKNVPDDEETETFSIPMIHTVAVAILTPAPMKRHNKDGSITPLETETMDVMNLVQLGMLPSFQGSGITGTAMEHGVWERLQENGHDLMIICGCTKHVYQRLEAVEGGDSENYPAWLYESPFNMPSPDNNKVSREQHNREIFFFQPLTEKFLTDVESTGLKFSFEIEEELLGYFGHFSPDVEPTEDDDEGTRDEIDEETAENNNENERANGGCGYV